MRREVPQPRPLIGLLSERFVGDGRLRLSARCDACPTVGDRRRYDAALPHL